MTDAPSLSQPEPRYDVFVSYAGEDRDDVVEPLIGALEDRGLRVWQDRSEITLGDDFRVSIEEGLRTSRFGVVVLSPSFYGKPWPEKELSAFHALERVIGDKRILPVRHAMTVKEFTLAWPLLGTRAHATTGDGPDAIADEVVRAVDAHREKKQGGRPSRLVNVPLGSAHFVGREVDLERVAELLVDPKPLRITASIHDLAGIGKTELALQLAHSLAKEGRFPGGIYWFVAENPDLTPTWGTAIADALGLPQLPPAERAALAIRTLGRKTEPMLLILDNVGAWRKDNQPAPLPDGTHVRILVTTREARLGGNRFRHVPLGVLDEDAARELLLSLAGRTPEDLGDVDALLAHLDGHALAVELAGTYLGEYPEETAQGYLALLREGAIPAEDVADLTRYERTARQAFQAHWNALDDGHRAAWRVAAQFQPGGASVDLLELAGVDARQRRTLRRTHLIESASTGRWTMHRLVRDFGLRAGTDDDRRHAQEQFVRACMVRAEAIDLATGFRVYVPERAQFDAAILRAEESLGTEDEDFSRFLSTIGTALQSMGDYRASRRLHERALASDLENLGEDHPSVAASRSNLALVLQDLGDLESARKLLERALAAALENLGEDHPSVATSRFNLAQICRAEGDLAAAFDFLERTLAGELRSLGLENPSLAYTRALLAEVLDRLGDGKRARREAREAARVVASQPEGSQFRVAVERLVRDLL